PMLLANPVRNRLRLIDSSMPEARIANLETEVANYITPQRFTASLLGFFAGLGLLLAAVGVYGVMRYWVSARIPDIGVRLALGAKTANVFRLVLGRAARAAAAGVVLGVAVVFALEKVIASELYGVRPVDPAV